MINLLGIGFLQALGVIGYISLISYALQNGERVFGSMNDFIGPVMFLTLFAVSALVCALITLGFPVKLFWIEKKQTEALKLVGYTTAFLALFVLIMFAVAMIY